MRKVTNLNKHYIYTLFRFKSLFLIIFILIIILFSCISLLLAIAYSNSFEFVSANGQGLFLNGLPFRYVGVNRYNLLSSNNNDNSCGESWTRQELDHYFSEMKQLNITAIRFWAFQSYTIGKSFSSFDYLISLSDKYNIKLIPVLENQWANCTQGGYKYDTWYRSGYLVPYGNYHFSFINYINRIVSHYRSRPEIMMWQIMNEAESKDRHNNSDFQALFNFAKSVSSYIKTLDPNHLINLGTIGSGQPGTQGNYYRHLYNLSTLNVLDFHDYNDVASPFPSSLSQRFEDSRVLNKPIIVDEAGLTTGCSNIGCYSKQQRAAIFRAKMSAFFREGGVGYIIWSYRDNHYSPNNPNQTYEFDALDPLAQVIESFASQIGNNSSSHPKVVK